MKIKQLVWFVLLLLGMSITLFFTFDHFKKEEKKYLENKVKNEQIEKERKEEQLKKELEEKKQQEAGQKEVQGLLALLQNTKKIILGIDEESGTLKTLDSYHKYKEFQTIQEEAVVKELIELFENATWQKGSNDNHLGKIWQFLDSEDNLLLEYNGHSFFTKEKCVTIYIEKENLIKLNSYFMEES